MTLRGHIQNGQVVLDEPHQLPDGTRVEITPADVARATPRGSADDAPAPLASGPGWDPSEELDELLAMLRREKQEELRDELDREEPSRSVA